MITIDPKRLFFTRRTLPQHAISSHIDPAINKPFAVRSWAGEGKAPLEIWARSSMENLQPAASNAGPNQGAGNEKRNKTATLRAVQGERGVGGVGRRQDAGRTGPASWSASQSDNPLETPHQ